jgi:hypothetical protein
MLLGVSSGQPASVWQEIVNTQSKAKRFFATKVIDRARTEAVEFSDAERHCRHRPPSTLTKTTPIGASEQPRPQQWVYDDLGVARTHEARNDGEVSQHDDAISARSQ